MLTKFIRPLGIFLIISFTMSSVLLYQFKSDIEQNMPFDETTKRLLTYPSYIENIFYDVRMRSEKSAHPQVESRIVLAAIDDLALKKFGRFPWSRTRWIKLLERLHHFGAKVVAFDVIFSEPEMSCQGQSPDQQFAAAIQSFTHSGGQIIIPYAISLQEAQEESFQNLPETLYKEILSGQISPGGTFVEQRINTTTFPIPAILAVDPALGFINAQEDRDGTFRNYPLITMVQDQTFLPSMALAAYKLFTEDPSLVVQVPSQREPFLQYQKGRIELNTRGETHLRWIGGPSAFKTFSLADLVDAADNDATWQQLIRDKIVLIGSTAFAAHDLRHTPIDGNMPGVFVHMNMIAMLLNGYLFQPADRSLQLSWILILAGSTLMVLSAFFKIQFLDLLLMLISCTAIILVDKFYLLPQGHRITLFFVLFAIIGIYLWNTILNLYLANKDKKFLKNAFGNYISPELIDRMYASGEPPQLGGNVGLITAFFTDIQGFSTFSEKLSAPQLVELLNEYLTHMTDILMDHAGTLDKYEGDAIVAFFGAPLPLPDHAIKACQVALAMQARLADLRKKWSSEGDKWPIFVHQMRMRVGINSGEIVTGNMGSAKRMNYTMMGDAVNLAARLEAAAKQYGIFIHISQFTLPLLGDQFELRELDTVRVVGKSEPVTTYDLLGEKGRTDEQLLQLKESFHQALAAYKAQQWDLASELFTISLQWENRRYPELVDKINPSKIYLERCAYFKSNPPPENWDGVYTLTEK